MESPAQPRAGHQTKGNPMLSIGLFAQQSGLTVKALRHYDEIGLLTPARIDDFTGYRYYSAGQLRDAAIIGTLRGIGLPLAQIAKVLGDQDAITAHLAEFEATRQATREREDRMLAEGRELLADYQSETPIGSRPAAAQPWVGFAVEMPLDARDDETTETDGQDINDRFDRFFAALHNGGCQPQPWWWLQFRELLDDDTVAVVWCIPVTTEPSSSVLAALAADGFRVEQGVLPERTERYLELGPNPAISADFTGPHPGLVRLWEEVADDWNPRQTYRMTAAGTVEMEFVADLPR